jgi:hypothetical protein
VNNKQKITISTDINTPKLNIKEDEKDEFNLTDKDYERKAFKKSLALNSEKASNNINYNYNKPVFKIVKDKETIHKKKNNNIKKKRRSRTFDLNEFKENKENINTMNISLDYLRNENDNIPNPEEIFLHKKKEREYEEPMFKPEHTHYNINNNLKDYVNKSENNINEQSTDNEDKGNKEIGNQLLFESEKIGSNDTNIERENTNELQEDKIEKKNSFEIEFEKKRQEMLKLHHEENMKMITDFVRMMLDEIIENCIIVYTKNNDKKAKFIKDTANKAETILNALNKTKEINNHLQDMINSKQNARIRKIYHEHKKQIINNIQSKKHTVILKKRKFTEYEPTNASMNQFEDDDNHTKNAIDSDEINIIHNLKIVHNEVIEEVSKNIDLQKNIDEINPEIIVNKTPNILNESKETINYILTPTIVILDDKRDNNNETICNTTTNSDIHNETLINTDKPNKSSFRKYLPYVFSVFGGLVVSLLIYRRYSGTSK